MTAKQMAYGDGSRPTNSNTYRLERGFPFLRAGVAVQAIPQFKGLTLYSHTQNTPKPFQNTQTGSNISYPIPPK